MIGYIYIITPHKCDDYYIGSTENMKRRKNKHTQAIKSYNELVYKTIRECGGKFDMVILYEYECENKYELKQEEQRALNKYKPKLNMRRAYRTKEDTKQYSKEWSSKYREDNKEQIREKTIKFYQKNLNFLGGIEWFMRN